MNVDHKQFYRGRAIGGGNRLSRLITVLNSNFEECHSKIENPLLSFEFHAILSSRSLIIINHVNFLTLKIKKKTYMLTVLTAAARAVNNDI